MTPKSENILEKYLPPGTINRVMEILRSEPVELKIKSPRKTKFGDYRFPNDKGRHRISINSNLNPFAFLITLLHEMAHLKAFKIYGKNIKPHGAEWQKTFLDICMPYVHADVFPEDVAKRLMKSLKRGNASSCTDVELYRSLKVYDSRSVLHLEDIAPGDIFCLEQGTGSRSARSGKLIFKKGEKARKRYKCLNLDNGREYMVHPLAEVRIVKSQNIDKSA